jgi:hypothetical protein
MSFDNLAKRFMIAVGLVAALNACSHAGGEQGLDQDETTMETEPADVDLGLPHTDGLPNYYILTRLALKPALRGFAMLKSKQFNVVILDAKKLSSSNVGDTAPERIRNGLRAYVADEPQYLLIVGAPDPAKQGQNTDRLDHLWEIPSMYLSFSSDAKEKGIGLPADQFYASVRNAWPKAGLDTLKFSFRRDFTVGIFPATTADEVKNLEASVRGWKAPKALKRSEFITAYCPYEDKSPIGLSAALATGSHSVKYHYCSEEKGGDIIDLANQDESQIVTSVSHGSYRDISYYPFKNGYSATKDSPAFKTSKVMIVHACQTAGLDYPETSLGAQRMLSATNTAAYVGYARSHWDIDFDFLEYVFVDGLLTVGDALYSGKEKLASQHMLSAKEIDNLFMLRLIGDPSLVLAEPSLSTEADVDFLATTGMSGGDSLAVTVSSLDGQPSSGQISNSLGFESTGLSVAGGASVGTSSLVRYTQYEQSVYVAYSGCDTSKETCLISKVDLFPRVAMVCGRSRLNADGTKSMDVRFLADFAETFELVLKGWPGMALVGDAKRTEENVEKLWSRSMAGGVKAGDELTITTSLSLSADAPSDAAGRHTAPYVTLSAEGQYSFCDLGWAEDNVFATPAAGQ